MWYEVDLRSRIDGESVECIYSGDDYEKAYSVAEAWNKKNLPDYKDYGVYKDFKDYINYTDGLFAYVYHIDNIADIHGVGKF